MYAFAEMKKVLTQHQKSKQSQNLNSEIKAV